MINEHINIDYTRIWNHNNHNLCTLYDVQHKNKGVQEQKVHQNNEYLSKRMYGIGGKL